MDELNNDATEILTPTRLLWDTNGSKRRQLHPPPQGTKPRATSVGLRE